MLLEESGQTLFAPADGDDEDALLNHALGQGQANAASGTSNEGCLVREGHIVDEGMVVWAWATLILDSGESKWESRQTFHRLKSATACCLSSPGRIDDLPKRIEGGEERHFIVGTLWDIRPNPPMSGLRAFGLGRGSAERHPSPDRLGPTGTCGGLAGRPGIPGLLDLRRAPKSR